MTNLQNIKVPEDIHSNITATYNFINEYLPEKYSKQVQNLLPEGSDITLDYIRQTKKARRKNPTIMMALYRVAKWNKLKKEKP